MKATVHFDGSCWPNPGGTAAYGYVVRLPNGERLTGHGVIGTSKAMSNNVAEFHSAWQGILRALDAPREHKITEIETIGDSQLVVNVMKGYWRAKSDKLYHTEYLKTQNAWRLARERGISVSFKWIPREENTECDDLSKEHNKPVISQDLLDEADTLLV